MTHKPATYEDWVCHLGKSTLDPELVAEFRNAGITEVPSIARGDFEESEDVGALTVSVRDPSSFSDEQFKQGVGVLSVITIHLKDFGAEGDTGPLPFDVEHEDSRDSLRRKLGPPADSDEC